MILHILILNVGGEPASYLVSVLNREEMRRERWKLRWRLFVACTFKWTSSQQPRPGLMSVCPAAAFQPSILLISSSNMACGPNGLFFPACLTDNTPERPLKALLALIALSLRSNMPVLIVFKCNQGLHSRGANNLNLTKHLRWSPACP